MHRCLDKTGPKRGRSFKAAAARRIRLIDMEALPPTLHPHVCPSAPGGAAHTAAFIVFIISVLQPRLSEPSDPRTLGQWLICSDC